MAFTPTDPTKAEVRITGTAPNQALDFYIPRGAKGEPGGLTQTDLLTIDLNTLTNISGAYHQPNSANGTSALGYPYQGFIGSIIVLRRGPERVTQFAYPNTGSTTAGNVFYSRVNSASGFGSWRAFNSTRVDQTAGRAIYQWDDLNNREQLIYGDTGQRSVVADQAWIDALTGTGLTLAGSQIARVRRVGHVVELNWAFDKTATGTITCTAGFPSGFRPVAVWNAIGVTSSMGLTRAYHPGTTSQMLYQSGNTAQLNVTASLTYTTTDPWPTTLPGTAVGSIPNL